MPNRHRTAAKNKKKDQVQLLVISNEPTEMKLSTLEMIYRSIDTGQLAYMDAKNKETGEVAPLLVGLEFTSDGKVKPYPLAKLLTGLDAQDEYLVPNGQGGYISLDEPVELGVRDLGDPAPETEGGETEGLDKNQIN